MIILHRLQLLCYVLFQQLYSPEKGTIFHKHKIIWEDDGICNLIEKVQVLFTSFSQSVHIVRIARHSACMNSPTMIPIQRPCGTYLIQPLRYSYSLLHDRCETSKLEKRTKKKNYHNKYRNSRV